MLPAFFMFVCPWSTAQTFTFTREVDLYFGDLAITSNTSVSSTTITRNGSISNTGNIFVISQGTPGEYTISDTTPFVALNLSITLPVDSSASFPGTEQLRLSAVDMPSQVTPDSSGSVTFRIGGTIETSGNGGTYLNKGTYPFIIELDVTY
jgi:hypothetical protein